jgi:GNAT superfamily N-acetyltransferase
VTSREPASEILKLDAGSPRFRDTLACAESLAQAKYLARDYPFADETVLLGAFVGDTAAGFLLLLLQVIGREERRPPIERAGLALTEGYVNAFGVLPEFRRSGIGERLQEAAIEISEARGCYQVRSRSPVSAVENYALKLKMGYVAHPSDENDSYFFLKKLAPRP